MKNLFLDTNIVIDLLARRDPFYVEAAVLFSLADQGKILLSVSAITFAHTNYLLLQSKKPEEAKMILRKLKLIVQVLPLNDKIVGLALNDEDFMDFEDGLQYYTALENRSDVIITRNLKGFQKAKMPVMTAGQFVNS